MNRKFTNKGNKTLHDLSEHSLTVLNYVEKKKVVLPLRKIKKKKHKLENGKPFSLTICTGGSAETPSVAKCTVLS